MAKDKLPKNNLVEQGTTAVMSETRRAARAQTAGQGISTAQEDNLVPLIVVLQPQSKACNPQSPNYVRGAVGGSIFLRNAPEPIVDGAVGILFQPCYFYKDFAEWIPRERGGGLVSMHPSVPQGAREVRDEKNPNKVKWIMPNGNEVLERRNHIGFVVQEDGRRLAYAIPFTSTGHSVSRSWMTTMQNRVIEGVVPASYEFLYRLKSRQRSNAQGTWFTLDITAADSVPPALLQADGTVNDTIFEGGKALFEACTAGLRRAAQMESDDADPQEQAAF